MARLDVNRSGEMEVFARIVELGGAVDVQSGHDEFNSQMMFPPAV
jgi:hypothetical protein